MRGSTTFIMFNHTILNIFALAFYLNIRTSFEEHSPNHQLFYTAFQWPLVVFGRILGCLGFIYLETRFLSDGISKAYILLPCCIRHRDDLPMSLSIVYFLLLPAMLSPVITVRIYKFVSSLSSWVVNQ